MPKLFVDGKRFLKPRPPMPWEKEVTFDMNSSSGSEAEGLPYVTSDTEEQNTSSNGGGQEDILGPGAARASNAARDKNQGPPSMVRIPTDSVSKAANVPRTLPLPQKVPTQSEDEDADDEQEPGEEEETFPQPDGDTNFPLGDDSDNEEAIETARSASKNGASEVAKRKNSSSPSRTKAKVMSTPKASSSSASKRKKRRTGLEDFLSPGSYYRDSEREPSPRKRTPVIRYEDLSMKSKGKAKKAEAKTTSSAEIEDVDTIMGRHASDAPKVQDDQGREPNGMDDASESDEKSLSDREIDSPEAKPKDADGPEPVDDEDKETEMEEEVSGSDDDDDASPGGNFTITARSSLRDPISLENIAAPNAQEGSTEPADEETDLEAEESSSSDDSSEDDEDNDDPFDDDDSELELLRLSDYEDFELDEEKGSEGQEQELGENLRAGTGAQAVQVTQESVSDNEEEGEEPFPRPYRDHDYAKILKDLEDYTQEATRDLEETKAVRGANYAMNRKDSLDQGKAQYGRLLTRAIRMLNKKVLRINKDDVFLDIGHGIGTVCFQVACTTGCTARGIEVVEHRHRISLIAKGYFEDAHQASKKLYESGDKFDRSNKHRAYPDTIHRLLKEHEDRIDRGEESEDRRGVYPYIMGDIDLRRGRLEDPMHRDFLSRNVTKAYLNNFNGVFAERSNTQLYFLDHYCAGLFALMKPGSVLVTFHKIDLGRSRSESNEIRRQHGLPESDNASFFEMETIPLGRMKHCVTWCQDSSNSAIVYVHKYTRVDQPAYDPSSGGVWLCTNINCPFSNHDTPLEATKRVQMNGEERIVINNQCECGSAGNKRLRDRPRRRQARAS